MNLENNPDEVWQCDVCVKLFSSYLEIKNHWHSIHIMDPKINRLTKHDIKDMKSQVTVIKKNVDVSNTKIESTNVKNDWMTIINLSSLSEFDEFEFSKEYEPVAKRTRNFLTKKNERKNC